MLEEFKEILLRPNEFFEDAGPQGYFILFRFWVMMCIIPATEFTLIVFFTKIPINIPFETNGILLTVIIFITTFLSLASGGLVFNFIYAGIIHFICRLFGCRDFKKTMTSVIISTAPNLLAGFSIQMMFTLGMSYFSSIYADYMIYIIILLSAMTVMWLWSLVINIIGISRLHEISAIKATVCVFIVPLIIIMSITAYLTRMSIDYVREAITSRVTGITIDASCLNGYIAIDLKNNRDDALSNDYIKVFVDNVDESQYFNFGDILPNGSNKIMGIGPEKHSAGKHKVEVKYHSNVAGAIVDC